MNGLTEGIQVSAQAFPTHTRRIIVSIVLILIFVVFCVYLRYRKPRLLGWYGYEVHPRPRKRHVAYFFGALIYIWAPVVPGVLPKPAIEKLVLSEIQAQIHVLQEKLIVADLHYSNMLSDEKRAVEFARSRSFVRETLPPPLPYKGLRERMEADLPRFSPAVTQRLHELEAAGDQYKVYAEIYKGFNDVEENERSIFRHLSNFGELQRVTGAWTTPIPAYRKVLRFLVIGIYLQKLRDFGPPLRKIGLTTPEIPRNLSVTEEPLDETEQWNLSHGIPPRIDKVDLVPSEIHFGHPSLR
jgi:hypothetical protein